MLLSTLKKIKNTFYKKKPSIITSTSQHASKGRVLFSYLSQPILWKDHDERFLFHSNCWESKTIVRLLNEFGFDVDCIEWSDMIFVPDKHYDIFFDISANLQRLAPFMPPETLKILYLTGSYPFFQMQEEYKRIADLEQRKNKFYSPKRISPHLGFINKSLQVADTCLLIGNATTKETYPRNIHHKLNLAPVSTSKLSFIKKDIHEYVPQTKQFLWFYGGGAVHKGLDLVLDLFKEKTYFTLNIIGNLNNEKDFIAIYQEELFNTPNIKYWGALSPSSKTFIDIIKKSFCFIAPSCSEGISPAAVTCLQTGLYPIISKNNGISLPENCGFLLDTCSVDELNKAINYAYHLSETEIYQEIKKSQNYALTFYSRETFTKEMYNILQTLIKNHFSQKK